jgi:Flp pilus assembly protein protease CpaA
MLELIYIATLALLVAIAYQDFKERLVSAYLLVSLAVALALLSLQYVQVRQWAYHVGINLAFILLQALVLVLYFRFVRGVKHLGALMGTGDVIFIGALALFFAPVPYILFYLISLILTLVGALLMALPKQQKTVPLAGFMAIQLIPVLVLQYSKVFMSSTGDLLEI